MKIGIIFAMNEELNALKKYLKIENVNKIYELEFFEGVIGNTNCVLVECGIGKVNAARATQVLIDNYKLDYVLNIGVAGGVSSNLKVGDIVVGEKLVQHDFDITAFNHEKGYVPNLGGKFINSSDYLIGLSKKNDIPVKYGVIASGDIFCTDVKMSNKIYTKFDALCVEMEGAAIAQVCHLCKVPFLIIRSISDVPNNENHITFDEFLLEASSKVADYLYNMLNKIEK